MDELKYKDETDKAYGLAGMAISLVVWDAEEWLDSIDLDAKADEAIHMSEEFYLNIAPRIGAKAIWEQALKRFQLTAAMMVANVACREIVKNQHGSLPGACDSALRKALNDEGAELCSLEQDEVSRIYGKSLNYCSQLFAHPGVKQIASAFADTLQKRRSLIAEEILELLEPLNRI